MTDRRYEQNDFNVSDYVITWPVGSVRVDNLMFAETSSAEVIKPIIYWALVAAMMAGTFVFTLESRWFWNTFGDALAALEGNIAIGIELSEILPSIIVGLPLAFIAWRMTKRARGENGPGLMTIHTINGPKIVVRMTTKRAAAETSLMLMRAVNDYYKRQKAAEPARGSMPA